MMKFLRLGIVLTIPLFTLIYLCGCSQSGMKVTLDVSAKPFNLLSEYHFFNGLLKDLKPNDRVLPYDLISPLFTDYAFKARFLYMPDGKSANYNTEGVVSMPVGACLIKNFYYPADFRNPQANWRIMETRLLVNRKSGWEALSYVWNDEQTDAKMEVAGDIKKVSWIHNDGSKKEIDYVIPSKNQCKSCHMWNGSLQPIGPKPRNLNHNFTYGDTAKNQLVKWIESGILQGVPADQSSWPKMANYLDDHAELNDRARSYLDINCAHCHNPKGPAYTSGFYLNYENKDTASLGWCKAPVAAGRGTGDLLMDLVPGHPEQSIVAYRMASNDAGIKMPEIGRSIVHKEGLELITQWIKTRSGNCAIANTP